MGDNLLVYPKRLWSGSICGSIRALCDWYYSQKISKNVSLEYRIQNTVIVSKKQDKKFDFSHFSNHILNHQFSRIY